EKETNKKINESIITKDVIEDNLLMKIFNDSEKAEEYKSLGLIVFRDYLISITSEVEESFVEAIMTKIDSEILEKPQEIKGEKENKKFSLIYYRYYLISIRSEIEESFVEAIMTKIDRAILKKTEKIKGEKEKIGS